jgi:hypothetical protein
MPKGKHTTNQTNLKYIGPFYTEGFLVGQKIWNPDKMSASDIDEFITLVPEAADWWVKYESSPAPPEKEEK